MNLFIMHGTTAVATVQIVGREQQLALEMPLGPI